VDGSIEAHRRYLTALRHACAQRPALHEHQLAALDAELALAAGDDLEAYLAAGDDLFELTRAARLDRLAGEARVGVATGDPWRARAAAVAYAGALDASGHADWGERTAAAAARAEAITSAGADATGAFTRLVLALLTLHGAAAGAPEALERARAELAALMAADPAFALDRPPYALRLPWDAGVVEGWLAALDPPPAAGPPGGDQLAAIETGRAAWLTGLGRPRATAGHESSVALGDPAAAYRALSAADPRDDPVALATREAAAALVAAGDAAATPQEALIAFVAEGLLTRLAAAGLRARAAAALERQAFWPDPRTARHWGALVGDLDRAHTPTEVDLIAVHAAACLAVESDWNVLHHGALTAPLIAAIAYDLEPDPRRAEGVRRAAQASHALTGLGPRAALAHPAVAGLAGRDPGAHGTEEGEAGYDLLTAVRGWSEATGEPADAAALSRLLDRIEAPEPATGPRATRWWGSTGGERPPLPGSLP
jgi:hypothetical protein